jgi:hypothetical protein
MEAVLTVHNAAALKKMIKFVSVRASQVASQSSNVGSGAEGKPAAPSDAQKQDDLNQALQEFAVDAATAANNDQDDW